MLSKALTGGGSEKLQCTLSPLGGSSIGAPARPRPPSAVLDAAGQLCRVDAKLLAVEAGAPYLSTGSG